MVTATVLGQLSDRVLAFRTPLRVTAVVIIWYTVVADVVTDADDSVVVSTEVLSFSTVFFRIVVATQLRTIVFIFIHVWCFARSFGWERLIVTFRIS